MSIEIYYRDSVGNTLCFRHAVVAASKGESIDTVVEGEFDSDSYGSGFYFFCTECSKETE